MITDYRKIVNFAEQYDAGKLKPHILNENIERSYSKFPSLKVLFSEVNITKINSDKAYQLARDD